MEDKVDEEIKIVFLGESGVGKTSIIKRYIYDKFNEEYFPSISMNYVEKQIVIDKKTIKLYIWDTIGQEKYRALSKLFLNDTEIVILVYSIDDSNSFKELEYWKNLAKEQIDQNVFLGVVGNKSDLYLYQQISELDGKKYAEENKAIFSQLSAKENRLGINNYINKLVSEYLKNKSLKNNNNRSKKKGIVLSAEKIKDLGYDKRGCCGGKAKARRKRYEDIFRQNNGEIESIFLGGEGVGKTSLIKRIEGKDLNENESHTTKELTKYQTQYSNSSVEITLNIYDISKDKIKSNLIKQTLQKCHIYFLVYDINDMRSINEIKFWIEFIKILKGENSKNPYVIAMIGNKKDLLENEEILNINNEEINNFKKENLINEKNNTIFFSTSAKSNDNEIKDIIGIAIEKFFNSS